MTRLGGPPRAFRPPIKSTYQVSGIQTDIECGPLVYCLEEADNPGAPVQRLLLPRASTLHPSPRADLLGGAVAITADALRLDETGWTDTLYRPTPPTRHPVAATAIPYYLWNNRGPHSMSVWIPEA